MEGYKEAVLFGDAVLMPILIWWLKNRWTDEMTYGVIFIEKWFVDWSGWVNDYDTATSQIFICQKQIQSQWFNDYDTATYS